MVGQFDRRRLRGEQTRRRLLHYASHEFAKHGFDATTTRMLADAAGVNQAAILYHFGSKEGLYNAIAEEIAMRGREAMAPYLSAVPTPISALNSRDAREALQRLLRGLLQGFVTVAGDGSAAAFIVREQANPGPAFALLYGHYIESVHEHVTALVAAISKLSEKDSKAILTAHAIIGMALVFVTARETALRRTRWRGYTPKRLNQIAAIVVRLADSALQTEPAVSTTTPGE